MTREIKFRAWDTRLKEWLGAEHWFVDPDEGKVFVYHPKTDEYIRLDHVIPVQFTGLLDKNGKEVYEGDIVLPYRSGTKTDLQVVKYLDHGFTMCDIDTTDGMDGVWYYDYEVVGNIYENPYLLEGK